MLKIGVDLLRLQPRDEIEQSRRPMFSAPSRSGKVLNEQYERALLHASNEATVTGAPSVSGEDRAPSGPSIVAPIVTHWTRILHQDIFDADTERYTSGRGGPR